MATLTTWQRAWMAAAIAVWVVVVILSGLQAALMGWSQWSMATSWPAADEYPEVLAVANTSFTPPEAGLEPGDRLVAVDDADLRGVGPVGVVARWFPPGERGVLDRSFWEHLWNSSQQDGRSVTVRYLRAGEPRAVLATVPRDVYNTHLWVGGLVGGLVAIFVGLRAPQSRAARAYLLAGVLGDFLFSRFFFASEAAIFASSLLNVVGGTLVFIALLYWALLMPEEAAPKARWPYLVPWILLLRLPVNPGLSWLTGGAFGYLYEREAMNALMLVPMFLAIPAILVRNYVVSGPLGRRQLKWLLLALTLSGTWFPVQNFIELQSPGSFYALTPINVVALLLLPAAVAISILRFNLFDIDRVLSATAAFGVAGAVLLVAAALAVPYAGSTLNAGFGVQPPTGQLVVGAALAVLVLPSQRLVRPWVDRAFFRERVALLEGFEALVAELTAERSRRSLLSEIGRKLEGLLHLESMGVYAASGNSFAPVFTAGPGAAELGHERSLVEALRERSTPLARARGGRASGPLSPFERAALEALEAEVVLPLRRRGALDAFIRLGRKRSGDVYTSTDLALLGSLADKASLKLAEFEEEGVEERHLSAIVSADVVGYSRLMSLDEQGTIDAVAARRELVERLAREHHGRVVDFVGDNFLAEFPSALDATGFALEVQREVERENAELPEERHMRFRLGVHLGDVTARGKRIYGDGVNVAARLEALAEPGGICISAAVHEQVEGKLRATARDMGEREVKNIARPIRVFALTARGVAE